jgi:glucan biosynthesis protein C
MNHLGTVCGAREAVQGAKVSSTARIDARQHYWDVVRGLLMLVGVPYHAALIYDVGMGKSVQSPDKSFALSTFADIVHTIRMPAFFVVAGYFAAMLLLRRRPRAWLKGRLARLGIPLIVCMALISPLQTFINELGLQVPALAPRAALSGAINGLKEPNGIWIKHLWFLEVLLYYCAGAALLSAKVSSLRSPSGKWASSISAPALLFSTSVVIGCYQIVGSIIWWRLGLSTGNIASFLSLPNARVYLPFFAVGFLVQREDAILQKLMRPSLFIALVALTTVAADVWLLNHGGGRLEELARTCAALAATQTLLAAARTWLDRPNRLIGELVSASLVIYLFHMPIILALGICASFVAWPPVIECALITILTLCLTFPVAKIVSKSPLLNLLFNGVMAEQSRPLKA